MGPGLLLTHLSHRMGQRQTCPLIDDPLLILLIKNGLAHRGNVFKVLAELRKNDSKHYKTSPETEDQRKFVQAWQDRGRGTLIIWPFFSKSR